MEFMVSAELDFNKFHFLYVMRVINVSENDP